MSLSQELQSILTSLPGNYQLSSELGFFSKPGRITGTDGKEYIIKLYRPLKTRSKAEVIIRHHDLYIEELKKTGILVPPTAIGLKEEKNRFQIIVIQPAFAEKELVRGIMESCNEIEFFFLLEQILNDTLKFWKNKPGIDIGFHPTLRNYAWSNGHLHYFDTFPPMLTSQKELNKLIIYMAPVKVNLRAFIPNSVINRVSDEYYQKDKMIIGIIGSSCRLRPKLVEKTLSFCREYISQSIDLKQDEKDHLIEMIKTPPQLTGIWVSFRKLFGKTGKPNVK